MRLQDLTGQVFGRLTVVERGDNDSTGHARWNCVCECGSRRLVQRGSLKSGTSKSCGCLLVTVLRKNTGKSGRGNFRDLKGQRFGRLVALERVEDRAKWVMCWLCQCDCGKQKVVIGKNLKNGVSTSCGCLQIELTILRSTKHGCSSRSCQTPEYRTWKHILQRTSNPKTRWYVNYGGRGITMCEKWSTSFENFFTDMGLKPSPKHSIERRDNEMGYTPENCYWATTKEQNRNTRRNRFVEYRGERKTVAEWSEITGIAYGTLLSRLSKCGMTPEQAIETPIGYRHK